jgi:hypothetical protein
MLQKVRLGTLEVSQPSTIISTVLAEFGRLDLRYLAGPSAHGRHRQGDRVAVIAGACLACSGDPIRGERLLGGFPDQVGSSPGMTKDAPRYSWMPALTRIKSGRDEQE